MRAAVLVLLLAGCASTTRPPPPMDDLELDGPMGRRATPAVDAGVPVASGDAINQEVRVEVVDDRPPDGPRIDLAVRDADVADVLRMIAAAAKISVVVTDDVNARVTLEVSNVTWRQAIDVIAQLEGLDVVEDRGIVTVTRSRP